MAKKEGSVFGGALLIAGSCIGAGMLGLPIITGLSGYFPSLILFFISWIFMMLTAFYLIEVNAWFPQKVNLITMVEKALGKWGKFLSWILYLFLFYALLVAYLAGVGSLMTSFFQDNFNFHFPEWIGSILMVGVFGTVVYLGTRKVDLWNRYLMLFKILAFLTLVLFSIPHLEFPLLKRVELSYAVFALPILVISFGFHNMIPSITAYMQGDIAKVKLSIFAGGLLTLAIYIIWQTIVLGIVPLEGASGILDSLKKGEEASQAISGILGGERIAYSAQALAFFAILTSFLAQALSLSHFLADGLKINYKKHENLTMCALALLPPLILSLIYPQIFFKALNFAGGICAVVLFGMLPVMMVYRGRYLLKIETGHQIVGGKVLLFLVFCFALFIFLFQISDMLNVSFLPKKPN